MNLYGTATAARPALQHMRSAGSIVNVSSVYGVIGRGGMGQYDVTKAAVLALTRTLAIEAAGRGIRVNAVCPGSTLTPFHVKRAQGRGISEAELREAGATNNLPDGGCRQRDFVKPFKWNFTRADFNRPLQKARRMSDNGRTRRRLRPRPKCSGP